MLRNHRHRSQVLDQAFAYRAQLSTTKELRCPPELFRLLCAAVYLAEHNQGQFTRPQLASFLAHVHIPAHTYRLVRRCVKRGYIEPATKTAKRIGRAQPIQPTADGWRIVRHYCRELDKLVNTAESARNPQRVRVW